MAYLETIPLSERQMMLELDCSGFEDRRPWVVSKPLEDRRVAIVSTADLNVRSEPVYQPGTTDYRVIPGNIDPGEVVMSHASVNFDRTGFQQDLNICFPIQRLHELADEGVTGSMEQALMKEIQALGLWYDLAVRTWGRATVGPSGLSIEVAGKFLAGFLEDRTVSPPRDDLPKGHVLKLAYEDLKAYYGEAITTQPGDHTRAQVETWLFNQTVFGQVLWTLRDICRASDNEQYNYLGRNSIVPDRQINPPGPAAPRMTEEARYEGAVE